MELEIEFEGKSISVDMFLATRCIRSYNLVRCCDCLCCTLLRVQIATMEQELRDSARMHSQRLGFVRGLIAKIQTARKK